MSLTQSARAGIRDTLGVVKLIAGLVLLVAISWEIIAGDHVHMSRTYLAIQFIVCLVFFNVFIQQTQGFICFIIVDKLSDSLHVEIM